MELPSGDFALRWFEILPAFAFVALLFGMQILSALKTLPSGPGAAFVIILVGPAAIYVCALFWGWGRERRALSTWQAVGRRAKSQATLDAFALRKKRQAELDLLI